MLCSGVAAFTFSGARQAKAGAGRRIRTDDLLITNQLLYQLSYAGIYEGKVASNSAAANSFLYAFL